MAVWTVGNVRLPFVACVLPDCDHLVISKGMGGTVMRTFFFDFDLPGLSALSVSWPFEPGSSFVASSARTIWIVSSEGVTFLMVMPLGALSNFNFVLAARYLAVASSLSSAVPPAGILMGRSLMTSNGMVRVFLPFDDWNLLFDDWNLLPATRTLSSSEGTTCWITKAWVRSSAGTTSRTIWRPLIRARPTSATVMGSLLGEDGGG